MTDGRRISTAGIALREGKVFVALRKPGTTIGESWEFPGGKAEPGETPADTLKREYIEEFDLKITVGDQLCEGSFNNGDNEYRLVGYQIYFKGGSPVLKEHSEYRWVSIDELPALPMAASDKQIARCLMKKKSSLLS